MSRMSKYLKQKCTYEKMLLDKDGEPLLDKFGEPQYEESVTIRCRREITVKDVQTNTGAILQSTTLYYTDDRQFIQAGDKLDGRTVIVVREYTNQFGTVEGFESRVE